MKIIKLSFIIFFILNFATAKSQNLENHKTFFNSQILEFEIWLNQFNKEKETILQFEKIYIKFDTILALKLKIPDNHNWERLKFKVESLYDKEISDVLIEKFAFLMDLQLNQCFIVINGKDVKIEIEVINGMTKTFVSKKQGEISDNIDISIGEINNISKQEKTNSTKTISAVKKLLEIELKNYFKKYEASFESYEFKSFTHNKYKLIIDINNVVDVVLDKGHFEHIRIDFTFTPTKDNLKIEYKINAKHAAGIIWKPFDSDFKETDPKGEKFIDFNLALKDKIDEILKK